MICPDCGNECSTEATACPQCAHPFIERETVIRQPVVPVVAPVEARKVVVRDVPREKSFPNWLFAPIAIVLVVLVFAILYMMRDTREDEAAANANSRVRETAAANSRTTTTTSTSTVPQTVNPAQSAGGSTVTVPSTDSSIPSSSTVTTAPNNLPSSGSSSTTVPQAGSGTTATESIPKDKGDLKVKATIVGNRGSQPVKAEKFYLLDKDLESILSKAGIEMEAGDYASTLGAAIADPNRKDLLQKCLAAIKPHIIASTLTDATGAAQFKGVKPDSYYLFGVHKIGNSASVWNTSISIQAGDNSINLDGTAPSATNGGISSSGY
jgi:hypothetical protein